MYSDSDFERFYIRYMAEVMPRRGFIQGFCSQNKVFYNLFEKWYRATRHSVVSVTVNGTPR